jgi:hypothetical protein
MNPSDHPYSILKVFHKHTMQQVTKTGHTLHKSLAALGDQSTYPIASPEGLELLDEN